MGMTFDEAIETIKGNKWIACSEKYQEAMNLIETTTSKYQKIEQILHNGFGKGVYAVFEEIVKVVEDGSENNHHASNT